MRNERHVSTRDYSNQQAWRTKQLTISERMLNPKTLARAMVEGRCLDTTLKRDLMLEASKLILDCVVVGATSAAMPNIETTR